MAAQITTVLQPLNPFPHRLTVTEDEMVTQGEAFFDQLEQNLQPELSDIITEINAVNTEINTLATDTQNNAIIATGLANFKGAWSGVTTYAKGQSVESTLGSKIYYTSKVDGNLNHIVTDTNYWLYNPINDKLDKDFSILTDKPTPISTDIIAIRETGGLLKKLSWDNLKITLKTYFDTVYANVSGYPAFSASKSSQSFTGNVWTKLACNTEEWDITNNYDTSTYRFTPNKAGKYRVTIQMQSTSANTGGAIAIYKNGSVLIKLQGLNGTTIGDTFSGCYTIELNGTTDYIEAYGLWNSNNTASLVFQAEYISGV